jgi:leader peptidase (prepilin peptidase)/N-methyltransferase
MGDWWFYLPTVLWALWVLLLGLMVGSFLNVLVARLPYEKSVIWPGSRCFSCYRPIRLLDNVPILGYLRLRGRCRHCGAAFSARYLWVEVGTGLAFVGLFVFDVLWNPWGLPGVRYPLVGGGGFPPGPGLALFAWHAVLVSCLIAAAVIDAGHRIIPPVIPYIGAVAGLIGAALMPWPWPHDPAAANELVARAAAVNMPWALPDPGAIPVGAQPWPSVGPPPGFAPPGSWQLGLLNAVVGALAGSFVVRWVRWMFGMGLGREALGMGDADLLMMAGAFLGWQIAVCSLFAGAIAALVVFKLPGLVLDLVRRKTVERELSFGPGLAVGVVATWLAWPWFGPLVRPLFFDLTLVGVTVVLMSMLMLAAGLLLRRRVAEPAASAGSDRG